MGRTACGVRGMRMGSDDARLIALIVGDPQQRILTVTEKGYGKQTNLDEFRLTGRGGRGVIAMQVSDKNGPVMAAESVSMDDDVMLISDKGTLVRMNVKEISCIGRNTQGVRLIRVAQDETLLCAKRIADGAIEQDASQADVAHSVEGDAPHAETESSVASDADAGHPVATPASEGSDASDDAES